ncbi:hypothetical protein [Nitrospirillum sp. BR 11828]|uniref:hypothetical protein n=1 Tax=Nitrospirillum sp. BR 11828 TaxID=3104325 RepID=UPI002ACA7792|nr:hypothetical protein [Nitrospirillum sp. BR 11828]MDZ5645900.1 hypothetical protein [Nitrospirillum sp. BR 11828]
MYHPEALAPIITFLREIGIGVEVGDGGLDGFLPGVNIHAGVIHVHPETLVGSGDLLHEAGHIAIVPERFRTRLGTDLHADTAAAIAAELGSAPSLDPILSLPPVQGEVMAQAWSYAAALHIGVPLTCVFFPGSYKHTDYAGVHPMQQWLESGTHHGPNALARAGMTGFSGLFAFMGDNGLPPFPHMARWVQA